MVSCMCRHFAIDGSRITQQTLRQDSLACSNFRMKEKTIALSELTRSRRISKLASPGNQLRSALKTSCRRVKTKSLYLKQMTTSPRIWFQKSSKRREPFQSNPILPPLRMRILTSIWPSWFLTRPHPIRCSHRCLSPATKNYTRRSSQRNHNKSPSFPCPTRVCPFKSLKANSSAIGRRASHVSIYWITSRWKTSHLECLKGELICHKLTMLTRMLSIYTSFASRI